MAEQNNSQERTEEPTARRKEEARKEGKIPRSKELNTMLSLLSAGTGLLLLGNFMATDFISLFESSLSFDRAVAFDTDMLALRFVETVMSALLILAPFFAVVMAGAVLGPLAMGGWSFSFDAVAFKPNKLNPLEGLKRIVSAKGLLELFKALIKFAVLSLVTYLLFQLLMAEILSLGSRPPGQAFSEAVNLLLWCLLALSFTMIFIVVFDVPFELWNYKRQLKMTLQEVKDEAKESEGKPEVKGRIRNLQREIAQRRMMDAVPTADVVITNPTHFAVALKYVGVSGSAPIVVAKGRDLIAQRIREIASDNEVALFSAPPLARALYASSEIGKEIPQNLYLAVARVLAYVYQLRAAGSSDFATAPSDLEIPPEYRELYVNAGDDVNG